MQFVFCKNYFSILQVVFMIHHAYVGLTHGRSTFRQVAKNTSASVTKQYTLTQTSQTDTVWCSGMVVIGHINEVTLHRELLVRYLGWVTDFKRVNYIGMACKQATSSTLPCRITELSTSLGHCRKCRSPHQWCSGNFLFEEHLPPQKFPFHLCTFPSPPSNPLLFRSLHIFPYPIPFLPLPTSRKSGDPPLKTFFFNFTLL